MSMTYSTGICAAAPAVMIGRELFAKRGVFRPEICVPAGPYIAEQARLGMEVE